ncbi:MAG TPA: hypothetical protein VLF63_01530 [Patescibacteria group bacterium]|nr:hypothetical protein [Patescibacteria group bacterium]
MATLQIIPKRTAITKANAQMVIIIAVASFVTVFCLIASKYMWSQIGYQNRVISKDKTAKNQLKANIDAFKKLSNSYYAFNLQSTNVIGGNNSGTANNDGDNATIILDSLPEKYDFPAVVSSIEKILNSQNFLISNISGTDDQVSQQTNIQSPNPTPVNLAFTFGVNKTNYNAVQSLMQTLQHSIRPIQIDTLNLSGDANNLSATVTAHTFFQPSKTLTITKQEVK